MAPPAFADWTVGCWTDECIREQTARCHLDGGVMVWSNRDTDGYTWGTCYYPPDYPPDPPDPPPPHDIPVPATITIDADTPILSLYNQTHVSIVDGVHASEDYEFRTSDPDPERLSLTVGFYDTMGIGATVTVTPDGLSYETELPD